MPPKWSIASIVSIACGRPVLLRERRCVVAAFAVVQIPVLAFAVGRVCRAPL